MDMKNYISIPGIPPIPGGPPGGVELWDFDAAITSSIRRIMQAASVAALTICSFTARGSKMFSDSRSATLVLITSMPNEAFPLELLALSWT